MSLGVRIFFIVCASLVVLCALVFALRLAANGWRFPTCAEQSHDVTEPFQSISLETVTADVTFLPTDGDSAKVVCFEEQKVKHSVFVEDSKLRIFAIDERKWYDYIFSFSFKTPKITVYLPHLAYGALTLKTNTGDVNIPDHFTFASVDIAGSTGDVTCASKVDGTVRIKISTGDISMQNAEVGATELKVSTGDVSFSGCAQSLCVETSTGDISVQNAEVGSMDLRVSTGDACLTNVICQSLKTMGDTGDVRLENVIAAEKFSIERSTGDVRFDACDAAEIFVKTDTGDVKGSLLSEKVFLTKTSTGKIDVPSCEAGGRCEITTSTGDIRIEIKQK
ncbi:MAG: DUF4097 family beta strand repeat protein [Clostridia bacterium]|nr:DUF4097 family beta strand repeat protein [Clostridia bacterium]